MVEEWKLRDPTGGHCVVKVRFGQEGRQKKMDGYNVHLRC